MALNVGINVVQDEVPILASRNVNMSVVGFGGTAPAADAVKFPLNVPVYFTSNDRNMMAALGATGTLPDAIRGVIDNLGEGQSAAEFSVVRTADNASPAVEMANLIGSEFSRTGLYAFLDAEQLLGKVPRLISAPGFTQAVAGFIATVALGTGGAQLDNTLAITLTGGGGSGAVLRPVLTGGVLTGITIDNPGYGYTSAPTIGFTGGGSAGGKVMPSGATCTVEMNGNPAAAVLASLAERLRALAVVDAPSGSLAAFNTWRATLASKRVQPVPHDVKVYSATLAPTAEDPYSLGTSTVTKPASPRAIGAYVRLDTEMDGVPSQSILNKTALGIVGTNRPIAFNLTDPALEGQSILESSGTFIAKGVPGSDTAIADGGFVWIGTDTLSNDSNWKFAHIVRLRDYIELTQIKTLREYLGGKITMQTVQAVLNTMSAFLSRLKAQGHIIDFRVGFEPNANSADQIRDGNITVMFRAEETPVLRKINIKSRRYSAALDQLVINIATALGEGGVTG